MAPVSDGFRSTKIWRVTIFPDITSAILNRDHFVYVPNQWETTLQCNVVSHGLDAAQNDPWSNDFMWSNEITQNHK